MTIPVVTTWHTDIGIAIAITKPGSEPPPSRTCPSTTRLTCSCHPYSQPSTATPPTQTSSTPSTKPWSTTHSATRLASREAARLFAVECVCAALRA